MSNVKVYDVQLGGPKQAVLVAWYERFREQLGPLRSGASHLDVILFAEYLLEHLADFQAELADYEAEQTCQPSKSIWTT